ncbi:hypothetical protein PDESU_01074 [Pontiella desulfatans]|uniref:Uncharacterized protein n=1 Tax=Pontiella desulfatans TaxID=2750659 RepID=A0A6C2TYU2_PONDE|nr:hypothetical protein [Pontiella desulfatans]VGO12521.1 hypothetical protein PDESU_01074 [Pontiella desulfatans]
MRNHVFNAVLLTCLFLGGASRLDAAVYYESGGLVIMEMENTDSPLGLWQQQSSLGGYTGSGYLQFLGNTYETGPATSPLEYTFKVNQSGLYYLHLHCAKETHDGRTDVANDCYVRVEGDYSAGPAPWDSHGDNAPLGMLQSDTKYFGGAADAWKWEDGELSSGGNGNLDAGGTSNKRVAVYDFKAGETYTLVVSGRSKFFRINRIMFRHTSVAKTTAQNLGNPESGMVTSVAEYAYEATSDFPDYLSGDVPYYIDPGNDALAIAANIEANRSGFARASRTFDGATGHYDVTITTLTEEDGESTYRLLVNGSVVATFVNTYIGPGSPQDLQPETHRWVGIPINSEDTLAIESNADTNGEIPEGTNGTAWARGRWRQIELTSSLVKPPTGRLAYVADGNSPDPDDIGANAVLLGLLKGAEQQDRLVHFSHSCDLVKASNISAADELRRQAYLHRTAAEGLSYFGPFTNLADYYNCRSNQTAAVANLTAAIDASTAADPLWIIEAGEPDIIGYALQAADPAKIPYVHVVSHHPANDDSGDIFTWAQILAFGVTEHQIGDQNVGLQVLMSSGLWDWAEGHGNPAMVWILDQLKYAEADGVVGFQTGKYDCSDAGMIYWWLTGADNGGNKHSTPVEIKDLLLYDGITLAPTVTMVALGSAVDSTAGSTWSDAQPAHSGAHYMVPATGNLRSESGTSTFPGDSLTVLAGGKFQVRSLDTLGETTTVNQLVFRNGTSFAAGEVAQLAAGTGNDLTNVLGGSISNSGYTKFLSYHAYSGGAISRSLSIQSAIDGDGHIQAWEGSTGYGGETVIIANAANTFSGTWEVGTDTTLVFNNAGAVGSADVVVLDSGKLRILGDWNTYANLTVADTATTSVDLGSHAWKVTHLDVGGTAIADGSYTAAQLNALGTNPVFSGNGTLVVGAAPPPPVSAIVAGWDTWDSATAPSASVLAPNVTASAETTTEQQSWNVVDERGASNDGDWGTFAGPPSASTVTNADFENLELPNATTGGTITFSITNNGLADIQLNAFHFDAYAFRPKAARAYSLSVLAGSDITVGTIYTSADDEISSVGGAWDNGAHDDIDLSLAGLADHTLAAGESVDFLLAFSSGEGDAAGGHDLWVDNVAVSQLVTVPPAAPPVLGFDMNEGDMVISWSGSGFKVQSCTNLTVGAWNDVPGGDMPPVTNSLTHPEAFYRLIEE